MKAERMAKSDITKRPKRNGQDVFHTLTKAGISTIPVVGSPANELLSLVITPSLEKRRDEWIESIAEALKELEEKVEGFKIENLRDNELFISTVMHASQAATRNHQKEKLEALKNVVLNAALPSAPEEDLQLMFLNFIDSFTTWHLRILSFLNNGERIAVGVKDKIEGDTRRVWFDLETLFPELKKFEDFFEQVIIDLHARGLSRLESIDNHARIHNAALHKQELTTRFGKVFLKFITSPVESKE